jgi:ABC-type multidrug transport system ATPase subunit
MDDPFAAVDVHTAKHLMSNVLNGILKGKTVILVTHNRTALSVCDHIYSIENGHLIDRDQRSAESMDSIKNGNNASLDFDDYQHLEADSIPGMMNKKFPPGAEENLGSQNIASHNFDIKNRTTVMEGKVEGSVRASTWIAYGRASGGYDITLSSFVFHSLVSSWLC